MPKSLFEKARSLFEKVWDAHVVEPDSTKPPVLNIDLHQGHEVTSPQAFSELDARGLKVRRPDKTLRRNGSTTSIPTLRPDADGNRPYVTAQAKKQGRNARGQCRQEQYPPVRL